MQTYQNQRTVRSSMTGPSMRLAVYRLPALFQDAATEHAGVLGVDADTLRQKSNGFWAITKMKFQVTALPRIGQTVTAVTWPNKPGSISCERNCTLQSGGTVFAQARTQWVILDCDSRKLRRIDSTCFPDMDFREEALLPGPYLRAVTDLDEGDFVYRQTVRASDIDVSNHTNNAVSCRMLLDCLPLARVEDLVPCQMTIHFLHESREGDELSFFCRETPQGTALLAKKADGTPSVAMLIAPEKQA